MNDIKDILKLFPKKYGGSINWQAIFESALEPYFTAMSHTGQNPEYHAEGDVRTHTQAVCEELVSIPRYWELSQTCRDAVFLAALLHDVGKTVKTRLENGKLTSKGHSSAGAHIARTLLWREFGLSGSADSMQLRETVCSLIRSHSMPPNVLSDADGERRLIKTASMGEIIDGYNLEMLFLLSEADARGRIADDRSEYIERVLMGAELAKEIGCFTAPYGFSNRYTEYLYMNGKNIPCDAELYDDTWGTVIMMSGLPGTGKDTFIKDNLSNLPIISLDDIRTELRISPTEPQGKVIDEANKRASALLREKTPFIWNATNITDITRRKLTEKFVSYKAAVKMIYLETRWEELLKRNSSRMAVVPEKKIEEMLEKLVPPEPHEAFCTEWKVV